MKQRILVIEDDPALGRVLNDNLTFEGFEVRTVREGRAALALIDAFAPALILLDIMLPDCTGFDLCSRLRANRSTSIIMLTARGQKSDKIHGLRLGADDYVTKPFDLEELLARVHAVLRRARVPASRLEFGPVSIDFSALTARRGEEDLRLSHREFEVLRYLAERADKVVHRDELLKQVWGYPELPETRSVDHAIARLRKKIEADPKRPRFIHTVHGDGYCLTLAG